MERKARVQRTTEEKWQIVVEGLKSGNIAETCRKYEIAPNLYYRWKDEVEQGAKEFDITLVGFLRDDHFNVYHGRDRIGGHTSTSRGVPE